MKIGVIGSMQFTEQMMNPLPDNNYLRTELEAMWPIIINGDLSKII